MFLFRQLQVVQRRMISWNYITARQDCRIEWFFSSLNRQLRGRKDLPPMEVNVIDYLNRAEEFKWLAQKYPYLPQVNVYPPYPNPWNGSHQRTKVPYFAPSVFRNTGAIVSHGDYLWFIDDLSVLATEQYVSDVIHASTHKYICYGVYKKVLELQVSPDGDITHYKEFPGGIDSRLGYAGNSGIKECNPDLLYGCSFGLPAFALEQVNGFDTKFTPGLGMEDNECGKRLGRWGGCKFFINPGIMTFESEELHAPKDGHIYFKRANKKVAESSPYRQFADEADWVVMNYLIRGPSIRSENHFDLAKARMKFLETGEFPPCDPVTHHWPDGQPLSEMD